MSAEGTYVTDRDVLQSNPAIVYSPVSNQEVITTWFDWDWQETATMVVCGGLEVIYGEVKRERINVILSWSGEIIRAYRYDADFNLIERWEASDSLPVAA